jgi:HPt (histidine-containing phosphotransfer) domain-containing protein
MEDNIIVEIEADIADLVPGFLENRKKNIEEIEGYLISKDFEQITSIAHKIKGSSRLYGFQELADISSNLEQSGKDKNFDKIIKYFEDLKNNFARIKVVIKP